jgi:hypothetical protein
MSFSLYYKKNKNEHLFRELENSNLDLKSLQNYIPLYENFFSLNESNFNNINLNHKFHLHSLISSQSRNIIDAKIIDIQIILKIHLFFVNSLLY